MVKLKQKYHQLRGYYYSYGFFFLKYFTFKKLFNLLLNIYEFRNKKIILKSIPAVVHIDVANSCVLKCPLCSTGRGDLSQTKAIMKFKEFKCIFDKVKNYTFFIWLYNWGEPFLCKDIFKIVDYCHKNNVGVKIDSNLNYYNEKILENIVKHKIDFISFSIDGLSQETYRFYRKNGQINKVLYGLEKIKEYKKTYKTRFPITVWQYLVNNKNAKEAEKAEITAGNLGIDIFEKQPLKLFTEVDSGYNRADYERFLSKTGVTIEQAKSGKSKTICRFLWCSLVFNPNNSYSPCPVIYKDTDSFGMVKKNDKRSVKEIINSDIFIESRKLFKFKSYPLKCFTSCKRCNWYTKPQ